MQRDRHSVAVANATARFEAILREQVDIYENFNEIFE